MKQFDIVRILTTKNIKYMSADEDDPKPHGNWIISHINGDTAIITKDKIVVAIPIQDVLLVQEHSLDKFLNSLRKKNGEETKDH